MIGLFWDYLGGMGFVENCFKFIVFGGVVKGMMLLVYCYLYSLVY